MSAQDFRASNYLGFLHYPPRFNLLPSLTNLDGRQLLLLSCGYTIGTALAAAGHNDRHDNSEDDHGKAWQGTMKGSATTNTSDGHKRRT